MSELAPISAVEAANRLIYLSIENNIPITQIKMQKLLYFSHGICLTRLKMPLVKEVFEAWEYGPVLRVIYNKIKDYKRDPVDRYIINRGKIFDSKFDNANLRNIVLAEVFTRFARESAGFLVKLSHAEKAPWRLVVDNAKSCGQLGAKISNDVIAESFRFHAIGLQKHEIFKSFENPNHPLAGY